MSTVMTAMAVSRVMSSFVSLLTLSLFLFLAVLSKLFE
jgi:hypothetical protein